MQPGIVLGMVRALLIILVVAAGALVALWRFDVVQLPLGQSPGSQRASQLSLFAVAKEGDGERLAQLLASGAEIDRRDEYGQTPLIYAITGKAQPQVLEMLIEAGADVNAATSSGWTPLMYAARDASSPQTVQLLMFAGADPTARNSEGQTAADLARRNPKVASTWLLARLQELSNHPFSTAWPSGYTLPVEGATLSSRSSHLPGAPRAYRNGTHEGFDFYDGTVSVSIAYGTPIHAVAGGVVLRADHDYVEMTAQEYDQIITTAQRNLSTPPEILDKLRGRQVWVKHPGGFISRYAHLAAISEGVRIGATVEQGDLIAATGNSGTLEAVQGTEDDPHPHVEIWKGDEVYLGEGMEACDIYPLAAQLFGRAALPPYTESCRSI